jgi:hypothetical protein
MRRLVIPDEVRRTTEKQFRSCGARGHECLVVWTCSIASPSRIVRAVHLPHAATAISTQVDAATLAEFNGDLLARGETAVAQLHTHPGAAFHSSTDDEYPLVHSSGFLSIVAPSFGEGGLFGFPRCFVAEYRGRGHWRSLPAEEVSLLAQWGF